LILPPAIHHHADGIINEVVEQRFKLHVHMRPFLQAVSPNHLPQLTNSVPGVQSMDWVSLPTIAKALGSDMAIYALRYAPNSGIAAMLCSIHLYQILEDFCLEYPPAVQDIAFCDDTVGLFWQLRIAQNQLPKKLKLACRHKAANELSAIAWRLLRRYCDEGADRSLS
jgi:hypothetical protein